MTCIEGLKHSSITFNIIAETEIFMLQACNANNT